MKKSRGFRNNNPLNIRRGMSHWVGQCAKQADKEFVQFETIAYGYRAAWKILASYYRRFQTIEKQSFNVRNIIYRWAPPTDGNDTEGYIDTVLELMTHLPVEEVVKGEEDVALIGSAGGMENLMPPETPEGRRQLKKLLMAMTCVENGCQLREVSARDVMTGYRLAFRKLRINN